jgi:hypothetical protein
MWRHVAACGLRDTLCFRSPWLHFFPMVWRRFANDQNVKRHVKKAQELFANPNLNAAGAAPGGAGGGGADSAAGGASGSLLPGGGGGGGGGGAYGVVGGAARAAPAAPAAAARRRGGGAAGRRAGGAAGGEAPPGKTEMELRAELAVGLHATSALECVERSRLESVPPFVPCRSATWSPGHTGKTRGRRALDRIHDWTHQRDTMSSKMVAGDSGSGWKGGTHGPYQHQLQAASAALSHEPTAPTMRWKPRHALHLGQCATRSPGSRPRCFSLCLVQRSF